MEYEIVEINSESVIIYYDNNNEEIIREHFTGEVRLGYKLKNGINWKGLKEDLFKSPLFFRALTDANPNAYATLLKIISDGEAGIALESNFKIIFNLLNLNMTVDETAFMNTTLTNNNFTIRF